MKKKKLSKEELDRNPPKEKPKEVKNHAPKSNRNSKFRSDLGSNIDRSDDSPMQDWAETAEDF